MFEVRVTGQPEPRVDWFHQDAAVHASDDVQVRKGMHVQVRKAKGRVDRVPQFIHAAQG